MKDMNYEAMHRKAHREGLKSSPGSFNPDFGQHMQKVKARDIEMRRAKQQSTKIVMRSV